MSRRSHAGAVPLVMAALALLSACGSDPAPPTPTRAPAGPGVTGSYPTQITATAAARAGTTPAGQATPALAAQAPAGGTAQGSGVSPANQGTAGEVRIGFAFATTGDNAAFGASQSAAARLAIDEINASGQGPKIAAVFQDTASSPGQAVKVFRKLINDESVDAIIGPTLSSEAQLSDPEAQAGGVPVLAVSNSAAGVTDIGDFIFRDSLGQAQVIAATVQQARTALTLTSVSLLYARDDAFSKAEADVFRQALQSEGVRIVRELTFSAKDTDFSAQLAEIKDDRPDAMVVSALAGPAQRILEQARRETGIDPKIHIIGGNGFNSPSVLRGAGTAADGTIVGTAWSVNSLAPLSGQFVRAYRQATGKDPDELAAQAYAGVYILYDAIERADTSGKSLQEARTAIRDALKSTKGLPTILGPFSFTDKRDADHPPVIQIVKGGKFRVLGAGNATPPSSGTATP